MLRIRSGATVQALPGTERTFAIEIPGICRVRATLLRHGERHELERDWPIQIADTDLEQRFCVRLDQADLAAVPAALR